MNFFYTGFLFAVVIFFSTSSFGQGDALSFNGSNTVVTVPNATELNPTAALTLEAWVNVTNTGNQALIHKWANGSQYSLEIFNNTASFVINSVSGGVQVINSPTNFPINQWVHVVGVYDGSTLKIYENAVEKGSKSFTGSINSGTGNLTLGKRSEINSGYLNGSLDEVRIWNIALSASQISTYYNDEFSDPTTPSGCLVAYYQMSNGSGISLMDDSGNGNDGTITNASWVSSDAGVTSQPAPTCASLPVELVDFKANVLQNAVQLKWSTASETNNEGFEIEESRDGLIFQKIGEVQGNGTTFEQQEYSFEVKNPQNGISYYRLKQIDFDGQFEYSKVNSVNFRGENREVGKFYPNPSKSGLVNLDYFAQNDDEITVSVYDMTGKLVVNQIQSLSRGNNNLSFNFSELNTGIYIVKIGDERNPTHRKLIIER